MDVSIRGNFDIAYTSTTSPNLMLRRWAFLDEPDSSPPANPPETTWIFPKGCCAELLSAEVVAVASESKPGFGPDSKTDFQVL